MGDYVLGFSILLFLYLIREIDVYEKFARFVFL